jgi:asparagine synthase (glutamine-hydrolysing)
MSAYGLIPRAVRNLLIAPMLRMVPDSYGYYSLAAKVRWVHAMSLLDGAHRQYSAMTYFGFPEELRMRLFGGETQRAVSQSDTSRWISEHYEAPASPDDVDRRLHTELMTRMPEHFLLIADRMSMAHGLEQRAPLVDREVAAFSARIPSSFKIRPGELKIILREVAKRYYPANLIDRKKQGFKFPLARWFKGPLAGFITQALDEGYVFESGLLERDYVSELLDEHKSGRVDHNLKLWNLLNLEVWYRLFIARDSRDEVRGWLAGLLEGRTPRPTAAEALV